MAKKQQLLLDELLEQALVKDEDKPYEVPENWVWVKLDYLCKYIQRGKSPKYSTIESIPVISQKCIQLTGFDLSKARFIDPSTINSYIADRFIQPMDLLWNSTGTGTVGRINCYPGDSTFQKLVADSHVTIIRPIKEKISPKCLLYWLSSPYIQDKIDLLTSGTTNQIELNTTTVKDQQVPLPPFSEQQRIVALIESLFEKLDRAKELAQKALDSFENRKSAILHKAFTGELTRKWRADNGVEFERDWVEKKLKEVCKLTSGGTPSRTIPEYYTGNILWIKTGEINWSYIFDSEEKITQEAIEKSSAKLFPVGTVLVAMYGQGLTRGRAAILAIEAATNPAVCGLLPYAVLDNKLLYYYFMCNYWKLREKAVGGNQPNFSGKMIGEFDLILPPLSEQKEIVRILDNLLENEQKAKELCDVIDKIDHMKKAILARAFRGELGTNNPDEESALELLKEVLKEKG